MTGHGRGRWGGATRRSPASRLLAAALCSLPAVSAVGLRGLAQGDDWPLECPDGSKVVAMPRSECPDSLDFDALGPCDKAGVGDLCIGDGACGTRTDVNNCVFQSTSNHVSYVDIYVKHEAWYVPPATQHVSGATTHAPATTTVADHPTTTIVQHARLQPSGPTTVPTTVHTAPWRTTAPMMTTTPPIMLHTTVSHTATPTTPAGCARGYWELMARQNVRRALFTSSAMETFLLNEDDPNADAFMAVGKVDATDDSLLFDGGFRFRLVYDDNVTVEWNQSSWLTEASIRDFRCMEPADCGPSSQPAGYRFAGLGRSHDGSWSVLDGDAADMYQWFNSVGTLHKYRGGIPGWNRTVYSTMELFVARKADHEQMPFGADGCKKGHEVLSEEECASAVKCLGVTDKPAFITTNPPVCLIPGTVITGGPAPVCRQKGGDDRPAPLPVSTAAPTQAPATTTTEPASNADASIISSVQALDGFTLSCERNAWTDWPGLQQEVHLDHAVVVMATYRTAIMADHKFVMSRLVVDGVEQRQTRSATGDTQYSSNLGFFLGRLEAGRHVFSVQVRTDSVSISFPDGGGDWQTRALDIVALPAATAYSFVPPASAFIPSDMWVAWPGLVKTITLPEHSIVVALYQTATTQGGEFLASRLFVDGREQHQTRSATGAVTYASTAGFYVARFEAGEHEFSVQYRSEGGSSIPAAALGDDWETRALSIFTLPAEDAQVFIANPSSSFDLSADRLSWRRWPGLSKEINLEEPALVLASYQTSTGGHSSHVVSKMLVDGVDEAGTRSCAGNTKYTSTLGFYIGQLEAGRHTFEVEYSTDSEENVFKDGGTDWQTRALSIIVLNQGGRCQSGHWLLRLSCSQQGTPCSPDACSLYTGDMRRMCNQDGSVNVTVRANSCSEFKIGRVPSRSSGDLKWSRLSHDCGQSGALRLETMSGQILDPGTNDQMLTCGDVQFDFANGFFEPDIRSRSAAAAVAAAREINMAAMHLLGQEEKTWEQSPGGVAEATTRAPEIPLDIRPPAYFLEKSVRYMDVDGSDVVFKLSACGILSFYVNGRQVLHHLKRMVVNGNRLDLEGFASGSWSSTQSTEPAPGHEEFLPDAVHLFRIRRFLEPVYDFKGKEQEHTLHIGEPWDGEEMGLGLQFYASRTRGPSMEPVYRFWHSLNGEYTFHTGSAWTDETRQEEQFYAYEEDGNCVRPVYDFWNPTNREHTFHTGEPWQGEEKRFVQFYAYAFEEGRPLVVEVETSMQSGADCSSGVDVQFLVGETWTKPEALFKTTMLGEVSSASVTLLEWPSRVMLVANGVDPWGYRRITLKHSTWTVTLVNSTDDNVPTGMNRFWIAGTDDLFAHNEFDIPRVEGAVADFLSASDASHAASWPWRSSAGAAALALAAAGAATAVLMLAGRSGLGAGSNAEVLRILRARWKGQPSCSANGRTPRRFASHEERTLRPDGPDALSTYGRLPLVHPLAE